MIRRWQDYFRVVDHKLSERRNVSCRRHPARKWTLNGSVPFSRWRREGVCVCGCIWEGAITYWVCSPLENVEWEERDKEENKEKEQEEEEEEEEGALYSRRRGTTVANVPVYAIDRIALRRRIELTAHTTSWRATRSLAHARVYLHTNVFLNVHRWRQNKDTYNHRHSFATCVSFSTLHV